MAVGVESEVEADLDFAEFVLDFVSDLAVDIDNFVVH